ncbi:MFS general substrate transporter [Lentinus tigrinus ALCF2SS1-7]|uniref:MFS general substrate transporter n=1 Tax=Lentinus tigrinus ALCF2SS1-6 TaxID=1328759 RepID=A0A5C2SC16_9APHY|nr:MFS general substrate transporter [Lentinus tigrinus ALCF2SS1-6]RPD69864.1 MFS general substrate transporter [Lentinus tigrinus ALCF2SS1-7]
MSLDEKDVVAIKYDEVAEPSSSVPPPYAGLPDGELLASDKRPAAERKLVRTLDMRLLPTIILISIMNYIDRLALTAARLKGLEQDLGLSDIQYATVLAIVYVSYIPANIPSNMIINRISRPSYYIAACVVLWGLASALTGVCRDYAGMLVARIFIGIPEAAFYPGGVYLLSRWYTKKELAFRSAIFYSGLMISSAFGSFVAAGILSNMEGDLGIRAWRWLYYIEGAITVTVGLVAVLILPDYPHNTRWLTPAQRRLAQVRLAEDAGEADEDSKTDSAFHGLIMAVKDPKVPLFAIMSCAGLLGSGFASFFPTIVATLGYSSTVTLLLAAPPWILATIVSCTNAWHADRSAERYLHICAPYWCIIVGYIVAISTMTVPGRYVSMFLMAAGFSANALVLAWLTNAVPRPPAKRSAAIAIVNAFGNVGTMVSSFVWKADWGPNYHQSMFIGIAAIGFATFLATVIRYILAYQNKKLEREELRQLTPEEEERIRDAAQLEGITYDEAVSRRRGFRYLL